MTLYFVCPAASGCLVGCYGVGGVGVVASPLFHPLQHTKARKRLGTVLRGSGAGRVAGYSCTFVLYTKSKVQGRVQSKTLDFTGFVGCFLCFCTLVL